MPIRCKLSLAELDPPSWAAPARLHRNAPPSVLPGCRGPAREGGKPWEHPLSPAGRRATARRRGGKAGGPQPQDLRSAAGSGGSPRRPAGNGASPAAPTCGTPNPSRGTASGARGSCGPGPREARAGRAHLWRLLPASPSPPRSGRLSWGEPSRPPRTVRRDQLGTAPAAPPSTAPPPPRSSRSLPPAAPPCRGRLRGEPFLPRDGGHCVPASRPPPASHPVLLEGRSPSALVPCFQVEKYIPLFFCLPFLASPRLIRSSPPGRCREWCGRAEAPVCQCVRPSLLHCLPPSLLPSRSLALPARTAQPPDRCGRDGERAGRELCWSPAGAPRRRCPGDRGCCGAAPAGRAGAAAMAGQGGRRRHSPGVGAGAGVRKCRRSRLCGAPAAPGPLREGGGAGSYARRPFPPCSCFPAFLWHRLVGWLGFLLFYFFQAGRALCSAKAAEWSRGCATASALQEEAGTDGSGGEGTRSGCSERCLLLAPF